MHRGRAAGGLSRDWRCCGRPGRHRYAGCRRRAWRGRYGGGSPHRARGIRPGRRRAGGSWLDCLGATRLRRNLGRGRRDVCAATRNLASIGVEPVRAPGRGRCAVGVWIRRTGDGDRSMGRRSRGKLSDQRRARDQPPGGVQRAHQGRLAGGSGRWRRLGDVDTGCARELCDLFRRRARGGLAG